VGALFVRRHLKLQPLLMGGHQEGGRRAGTENLPGIAGFGVAAREALTRLEAGAEAKVASLRSFLEESILWSIPYLRINGRKSPRLPNTSSLTVAGLDAKQLVAALGEKGFCISNGSACASGSAKPSHVLTAMGMTAQEALSTIRISLSADSTKEQIAAFAAALTRSAQEARQT
jgi:cysteine desulfurase